MAGCVDGVSLSSNQDDRPTFEEFQATVYKEPWTGGRYIVEGDIALDDAGLRAYWERLEPGALIVYNTGSDVKWSNTAKLNLTYCISDNFGFATDMIARTLARAAQEWERRANVNFIHTTAEDGPGCTNTNNNVVFNVRLVDVGPEYAARAFFPNEGRAGRELLVNIGTLGNTPAGLTSVFGHELGHILGFVHEHTRPEAGICWETDDWRELTPYDYKSIMHYPQCNGGPVEKWWTEKDRLGAAALYGAGAAGFADILWRDSASIAVWPMNGGTVVTQGGPISVGAGWQVAGTGDFNADGKADVLWRESTGQVAIWFMNGVAKIGEAYPGIAVTDWSILGAGDFDGDGTADILWRHTDGTTAIWLIDEGVRVADLYPGTKSTTFQFKGATDLDRDGVTDVLWSRNNVATINNPATVTVQAWLMNGGAATTPNPNDVVKTEVEIAAPPVAWQVAGAGDFDGDNHGDILWRHTDGTLAVWFMDGATKLGEGYPGAPGTNWQIQGVGDFDGDWKSDILWRDTSGVLAIWFMNGATNTAQAYPGTVSLSWAIKGVDRFD
jgi:hypothetical protein